MADIRLSGITIYPVKSCGGIPLESTRLGPFGPEGDRRWMLVDGAGQFVTQRNLAKLALVATELNGDQLVMTLAGRQLAVDVPGTNAPRRTVTVWGDTLKALDAGDAAADWLFESLGLPCRLVYMPEDAQRRVAPLYARRGETVSFADGFPLLLISEASLADLNARLDQPCR